MPARMLSTSVFGSVNFQLSARPGFGFRVSKSHSVSVSYIVNRKAWSEPAPPVAGSRLEGLAGAEIRKMPPFFGVPGAKALPLRVVPASAPVISAISSRRVVWVMKILRQLVRRKVRAAGKMAGDSVVGQQLAPVRRLLGAKILRVLAAGAEPAPRRRIDRTRAFPLQHDPGSAPHGRRQPPPFGRQ